MKKVARRHNLAALLHEKPFAGINGSGKHINWSIGTDDGLNLLNPGKTPSENIQFLVFLVAVLKAVYKHGDILRASVATTGNEHRLGANEAPPAIISVFLGDQLEKILSSIEKEEMVKDTDIAMIDLGLASLPVVSKDNTDRNRTSPFAFTGNKFEFRAVGSSQSISLPATIINMIVAESLDELSDKIEKADHSDLKKSIMDIIREELTVVRPVIFGGDNYTDEWHKEAEKRGLPNHKTTPESLKSYNTEKAKRLFEKYKVLSNVELYSRYHIHLEIYIKRIEIEARSFISIVSSQVIPAALKFQSNVAGSIKNAAGLVDDALLAPQKELLMKTSTLLHAVQTGVHELASRCDSAKKIEVEQEKAEYYCEQVKAMMENIRVKVDELETVIDSEIWPLPKFWEMLFIC